MAKLTRLGDLERAVMDHLWSSREPQTVRQVHEALAAQRDLAYTTIMTVLQRLAKKNLVIQHRDDRAHRYAPMHGRDELVAGLMVDALDQAADSGSREAALVHFVERVGADEAAALRRALAELETKHANPPIQWRSGLPLRDTDSVSALAFTLVALLLVGPVPALLARAAWPMRAPRAAIVLWQSIALAAVLSAFSAGIAIASRLFVPGLDGRPTATITSEIRGPRLAVVAALRRGVRAHAGRRRAAGDLRAAGRDRDPATPRAPSDARRPGRQVARLGARPALRHANDLRILDVEQPLAYCLPGVRSRVVVSEGTLTTLSPNEVTAILSHERAHLRARHDLVLEMFTAVHAAFPRFVRSANALDAVRLLVELLADDAAVRAAGPTPLARALVACAAGRTPSGALAAGGPTTVLRVRRLGGRGNSIVLAITAYLAAAAVLVVPTVALAVPWLTELHRLFVA